MKKQIIQEINRAKLLSRYDTRTTLSEQTNTGGHDDLMDGIDKMCIDKPWDAEKMVGNRSCRSCHPELIDLIKDYCGSFSDDGDEVYLDDPGMGGGTPSVDDQIKNRNITINEEGLIGPKTKAVQDWLDDFDDFCACPPPYAPCACNGAIQPPGVTPPVWEKIRKAKNKRVVEQILRWFFKNKI